MAEEVHQDNGEKRWRMSELATQIDRLPIDRLVFIVGAKVENDERRGVTTDEVSATMAIATEALRFFLGDDWTNENVFGCHKEVSRQYLEGRRFLKSESLDEDQDARFRWQQRVLTLAECLFNFQGMSGIKHRMSLLKHGGLESALGEMECAKLLALPELGFKFVVPTGKKGADYEAEITTASRKMLACEIKTKGENATLSFQTIANTVEDARKQFPKGGAGVVLLKLPESWIRQPGSREVVLSAIEKPMRQSQRLVAVVLLWEEWSVVGAGRLTVSRFKTIFNIRSRELSDDIRDVLQRVGTLQNPSWIRFPELVASVLPQFLEQMEEFKRDGGTLPPLLHELPKSSKNPPS